MFLLATGPDCDGFRIALTRRASATGFVPDQYKHACGGPPSGVCVLLQPFPRPPLPVFCCKLGTLENPKKETQINQNELDSDRERAPHSPDRNPMSSREIQKVDLHCTVLAGPGQQPSVAGNGPQ